MKQAGRLCRNMAGADGETRWVLIDYDDVVVHVFETQARSFYGLENLWADAPRVAFVPAEPVAEPEQRTDPWETLPESTMPDSGHRV